MLHTNIIESEKTNITSNKCQNIKNNSENIIFNHVVQDKPNATNNIKKPKYQEILWLTGC
jgi:hypothetical protein